MNIKLINVGDKVRLDMKEVCKILDDTTFYPVENTEKLLNNIVEFKTNLHFHISRINLKSSNNFTVIKTNDCIDKGYLVIACRFNGNIINFTVTSDCIDSVVNVDRKPVKKFKLEEFIKSRKQ